MTKKRRQYRRSVNPDGLNGTLLTIGPSFDPLVLIRGMVKHALDPVRQPGPVKTKADFSQEQLAEMERMYSKKESA
jgi:hypothetical protein